MSVCCECCVLSGRGLCDELITRPEETYRLCCVIVCDLETTNILVNEEEAKAHRGLSLQEKKKTAVCGVAVSHTDVSLSALNYKCCRQCASCDAVDQIPAASAARFYSLNNAGFE
jgi:hypothetical protein